MSVFYFLIISRVIIVYKVQENGMSERLVKTYSTSDQNMSVTDVIKRIRRIIYNKRPMRFMPQIIASVGTGCSIFYGWDLQSTLK